MQVGTGAGERLNTPSLYLVARIIAERYSACTSLVCRVGAAAASNHRELMMGMRPKKEIAYRSLGWTLKGTSCIIHSGIHVADALPIPGLGRE